jgi:hypothetical protein
MPAAIRFSPWSEEGRDGGRTMLVLAVTAEAPTRRRDRSLATARCNSRTRGGLPDRPGKPSNVVPGRRRTSWTQAQAGGVSSSRPIARRSSRSSRSTAGAPRAVSRSMTSNSGMLIEDADVALRCEHARRSMICRCSHLAKRRMSTSVRGNSRCHSGIGMCRSPSHARPTE